MEKLNIKSTTELIALCAEKDCTLKYKYNAIADKATVTFGFYFKNVWHYSVKTYSRKTHKGLFARYLAQAKRLGLSVKAM